MSTLEANDTPANEPAPLGQILRPIRSRLICAATLAGLGAALTLVPLAGIAHIAQIALGAVATHATEATVHGELWRTVALSIASLFGGLLLILLAEATAHAADNRLTHHLRLAAARRLAKVPLGWFGSRSSGEIKHAMQDDIGTLHDLTAHFYTTLGRTLGAILTSLVYLFSLDWRLALVALLPYVGGLLLIGSAMNFSERQMQAFGAGQARVDNAVVEFVNGIPVVKTFGAGGKAHGNYRAAVDGFLEVFLQLLRPTLGSMSIANALMAPVAVLGVVLAAGTLFVHLDWMTPAAVLPFALVAPGVSAPLMLLIFVAHGLDPAKGAAKRVHGLLRTALLEQPAADLRQRPSSSEIRIEQLSYAYDAQHKVLENLDFTLEPGSVTALVGPSGAGKSTLARLLLRFFDPSEGRITLGGVDLRNLESTELYRHIGFVLQEVRLIHASVRDNIALGRPSATRPEIENAARAANIHERILSLPRGYDSVIGEDAHLSGGEQQRVSIARAFLLNPPVLVLDEATAATDAENEVAIQEALSRFAKGRTLLIIAHRLDTVMHADRILVIDNGSIVEQGRHDALLARHGHYARLWERGGYQDAQAAQRTPHQVVQ
ncbi:ABC transporter ATP-binding protein [Pseudomonas aeruginosa]|uniref:ABC transporter ATP-binding protein n=2 Tax=Pseudomonas aeruginosa TaxID=287 RepID=UPI00053E27E7|nr:ABC transporter ATP-binding protein [Pseudomonas aeruginosa]MCD2751302.1 ABC transporter ATP-binding protein/permease [Pseudomonas aeruginosa]MDP5790719.1 ABC transporter ATP-binding protein [Pseudomonas aeruginosa]MDP5971579.1 ABC transporter ATP-binding protein [Pseudomonas aeruginosa]PTZ98655.1 ABC transporter ATP-binding protein [Pseudomonas aeruginosa]RMK32864.1 ABC transporter ATP-binding protein [Pseudomonas aeruginosa]